MTHRSRTLRARGTWTLLVLAAGAGSLRAELPPPPPVPRQVLPAPALFAELELNSHSTSGGPSKPRARLDTKETARAAFRSELREEAIDYLATNRWALADERLLGDRPVRQGRARATESMLGDAVGAALEVVLRDALGRPRGRPAAASRSRVKHQLRLDSSPTWRLRGRVGLTRLKLDVPLSAHDELSLRCTRRVDGDRCERELGASVRVNPWDESLRFGFELEF